MESLLTGGRGLDLRAVRVRPTWGAQEHRRWDKLVATHHYLSFQGLFGKGLRHVATLGSTWIALIGWLAGALKLTARDRWIGWSREQKLRRLHLVTQNSRFVILPGFHAPNLASRVLGLSLRRLSDDMLAAHGYPVLVAETFVDPARFAGTCYRAVNWRSLGMTGGYARQPGAAPDWLHHGQPKEILVFELQANAGAALRQPAEEPAWQGPARTAPLEAHRLRSLGEFLGTVPEYRHARGKRYSLRTVLVLAVAARLAGYRGVTAFAQPGPARAGAPEQAGPRSGGRRRPRDKFAGQERIRALVISGGCCHDYRGQDKILMALMADVLPVDWTILYEGGVSSDVRVALYDKPNWAEGFDVVIHNECYANVADKKFIRQITSAHETGVPAILIHCAMHSYRAATVDDWREFAGVTTRRHTRRHNIAVKVMDQESSLTESIPTDWTTPTDELYVIDKVWPNSKVLATAVSPEEGNEIYPVIWTNDFHGARVFGTTLGHGETFDDPVFRDLLVRAFKWTVKRE